MIYNFMFRLNQKKGFTLIELLVVIAIISILITAIMINIAESRRRSSDAKAKSELRSIAEALEGYKHENNVYGYKNSSGVLSSLPNPDLASAQNVPLNSSVPPFMALAPTGSTAATLYRWYGNVDGTEFCLYVNYASSDKVGMLYYYSSEGAGEAELATWSGCPGV